MLGGLLFVVCVILQFHYHDPIPWYIWVLALIALFVSWSNSGTDGTYPNIVALRKLVNVPSVPALSASPHYPKVMRRYPWHRQ